MASAPSNTVAPSSGESFENDVSNQEAIGGSSAGSSPYVTSRSSPHFGTNFSPNNNHQYPYNRKGNGVGNGARRNDRGGKHPNAPHSHLEGSASSIALPNFDTHSPQTYPLSSSDLAASPSGATVTAGTSADAALDSNSPANTLAPTNQSPMQYPGGGYYPTAYMYSNAIYYPNSPNVTQSKYYNYGGYPLMYPNSYHSVPYPAPEGAAPPNPEAEVFGSSTPAASPVQSGTPFGSAQAPYMTPSTFPNVALPTVPLPQQGSFISKGIGGNTRYPTTMATFNQATPLRHPSGTGSNVSISPATNQEVSQGILPGLMTPQMSGFLAPPSSTPQRTPGYPSTPFVAPIVSPGLPSPVSDNTLANLNSRRESGASTSSSATATSSNTNLYIRGLASTATDEWLHETCEVYGKILSSKAILDLSTHECKGYGFVMYETDEQARFAMEALVKLGYQVSYAKTDPRSPSAQESFNTKLKNLHDTSSTNLYISNLPVTMDEEGMLQLFAPHKVTSNKILRDASQTSRGVGFALMETREAANAVIAKLNGFMLPEATQPLQVRFADSAEQKRLKLLQHQQMSSQHQANSPHGLRSPHTGISPVGVASSPMMAGYGGEIYGAGSDTTGPSARRRLFRSTSMVSTGSPMAIPTAGKRPMQQNNPATVEGGVGLSTSQGSIAGSPGFEPPMSITSSTSLGDDLGSVSSIAVPATGGDDEATTEIGSVGTVDVVEGTPTGGGSSGNSGEGSGPSSGGGAPLAAGSAPVPVAPTSTASVVNTSVSVSPGYPIIPGYYDPTGMMMASYVTPAGTVIYGQPPPTAVPGAATLPPPHVTASTGQAARHHHHNMMYPHPYYATAYGMTAMTPVGMPGAAPIPVATGASGGSPATFYGGYVPGAAAAVPGYYGGAMSGAPPSEMIASAVPPPPPTSNSHYRNNNHSNNIINNNNNNNNNNHHRPQLAAAQNPAGKFQHHQHNQQSHHQNPYHHHHHQHQQHTQHSHQPQQQGQVGGVAAAGEAVVAAAAEATSSLDNTNNNVADAEVVSGANMREDVVDTSSAGTVGTLTEAGDVTSSVPVQQQQQQQQSNNNSGGYLVENVAANVSKLSVA